MVIFLDSEDSIRSRGEPDRRPGSDIVFTDAGSPKLMMPLGLFRNELEPEMKVVKYVAALGRYLRKASQRHRSVQLAAAYRRGGAGISIFYGLPAALDSSHYHGAEPIRSKDSFC
jgi:hypothetical protein